MSNSRIALLVVVAITAAGCAHPAHLSPTDRPDFTESAPTVPAGGTQVEMGGTFSKEDGVKSISGGEVLVRRGISPRAELRLSAPSYASEQVGAVRVSGVDDAGIGFKFNLYEGPDRPSIIPTFSVITAASIPSGSHAFRSQRALPEVKLIGAWNVSERIGFNSNVNWARGDAAGVGYDEFAASGSLGFELTERVGGYVEGFTFAEHVGGWEHRTYVNGGVAFQPAPWIQFDVRAGVRTGAQADGTFVGFGISRRF